ncbi:methyl-accepting chemotaxis protein [Anaerosporobacter sp.]
MEQTSSFFETNDLRVCKQLAKVLLWMTLAFPILFLMSFLKIWKTSYESLAIMSILGIMCTVSPSILLRMNIPMNILKYVSIISIAITISVMGSYNSMGIYMTYGLALACSCMYFDRKFTRNICIIAFVPLMLSLFIKKGAIFADAIGHMLGYTLEYVIMSAVFISLADSTRTLMNTLHNTENIKRVVSNCENSSKQLVQVVDNLASTMNENVQANTNIVEAVTKTLADCKSSIEQVEATQESICQMQDIADTMAYETDSMIAIADRTYDETKAYVDFMKDAVSSMKEIETTANSTYTAIDNLDKCITDISNFAETITNITGQTNLLALNASIEAARAGENGRGFAVVADQVRVLADESQKSSSNIANIINNILEEIRLVRESVNQNCQSVGDGIRKIELAQTRADELGKLQEDTKKTAEKLSDCSKTSKNHSDKVVDITNHMSELVHSSLDEINSIMEATKIQNNATESMEENFQKVEQISKDLLEISTEV